jgi:hypothetical protein
MTEPVFERGEGKVQLSEEAIAARVRALGKAIARDYRGKPLHLICVLNGAFIFMADLVRAIDAPLTTDIEMRCPSPPILDREHLVRNEYAESDDGNGEAKNRPYKDVGWVIDREV